MMGIRGKNISIMVLICLGLFILGTLSVYAYKYEYEPWSFWWQGKEAKFEAVEEINSYTNSFGGVGGSYRTVSYHWGKLTNNLNFALRFQLQGGSCYDWTGEEIEYGDCIPANKGNRDIREYASVPGASGDPPVPGTYSVSFFVTNSYDWTAEWPNSYHQIRAFTNCSSPDLSGSAHAQIDYGNELYF